MKKTPVRGQCRIEQSCFSEFIVFLKCQLSRYNFMEASNQQYLSKTVKRLATVKQVVELYPVFTSIASVQWLIFNEKINGFLVCTRRIGRRVWIDLD
ncbi:MAG: hypothetical protein GY821_13740 [Gammaproteobacteria bacterium]|nr:hypothetical protein [Gammaproteobacteria bacterium]